MVKSLSKLFQVIAIAGLAISCSDEGGGKAPPTTPPIVLPSEVAFWLTTSDKSVLFGKQAVNLRFQVKTSSNPTIVVDTTKTYQAMDGFGYTLTGGSATLIHSMADDKREKLLDELFSTDSTFIGITYLRISIGASDMSAFPYSYDDMLIGQTDVDLNSFSLNEEKTHLIPLLKEILAINPQIKILGSPWSAPAWMKDNEHFVGGSLKTEYFSDYAKYLVKYIQGMAAEGITIDAITPQNEPLNPNNNPSMYMTSSSQADFVKNHLGPAFQDANLETKIIVWDHNCDVASYPMNILADASANNFIDGSAFHLYAGNIDILSSVHNSYPTKNIYFTEQYTSSDGDFGGDLGWHLKNLIIGAPRNWSKNVLEWNLAADQNLGPHTTGGCTVCLGALTINGNNVTRNVSYYIIAHASKFVRSGAVRVDSNIVSDLQNVAYQRADGKKVLIVLNDSNSDKIFNIQFKSKIVTSFLKAGAVGTYVW